MPNIPYVFRIGALITLAVIMVLHDRLFCQGKGQRDWEYGFLFLVGLLGALYGAANDAVTSGLSPAYFMVGKGLAGVGTLKHQAIVLGAQAGFSAAVIACAICQFVLRRIPARQRCLLILRQLWIPFVLAPFLGLVLPVVCGHADPLHFADRLQGVMSENDLPGFLTVWWAHIGTYVGLIAGVVACVYITQKRVRSE